jgi:hypothetical protein
MFVKNWLKFPMLCVLGALCWACQEEPLSNYNVEESRVYLSNYDKAANWASYTTYYMPDTVFVLNNQNFRASVSDNSKSFLSLVQENFKNRGYTRVKKHQKPDLGLQVSRVSQATIGKDGTNNEFFNTFWGYKNFGSGGFVYPGIYTHYEHGDTVWNIELVDLKNTQKNNEIKVLWNAQIWGLQILDEDDYGYMVNYLFSISAFLPKTL